MKYISENRLNTNLRQGILKALVYFDLFSYPVSAAEILSFLDQKANGLDLQELLNVLVTDRCVFRFNEFYSLQNDERIIARRLEGNSNAIKLLSKARRISSFLYRFPYIRGIGISGSLSKNFAPENADIDYFIIARANRLWIARTILHLFKKLSFLTGRQHFYCMNYFVDEEAMEIEEKNIFTAMETVTLLPVCGQETACAFFRANAWVLDFYPNSSPKTVSDRWSARNRRWKTIFEFPFNKRFGDWLDDRLLKLTSSRWNKKEHEMKLNVKGARMGLRNSKHVSKPNPVFFQQKILNAFYSRLEETGQKWESHNR